MSAVYIGTLGVLTVGAGDQDDYTAEEIEPIIDQAIYVINAEVGLSITHLSGSAGAMEATLTDAQMAIVGVLTLILGINAKLSQESTQWSIERRENCAEMIGDEGSLTRRYEALISKLSSGDPSSTTAGIALLSWNDPLPSEEE